MTIWGEQMCWRMGRKVSSVVFWLVGIAVRSYTKYDDFILKTTTFTYEMMNLNENRCW